MLERHLGSGRKTFHQSELSSSRWECLAREWDAWIPGNIQVLVSLLKKSNSLLNLQANWILPLGSGCCQGSQWLIVKSNGHLVGLPYFICSLWSLCHDRKQFSWDLSFWVLVHSLLLPLLLPSLNSDVSRILSWALSSVYIPSLRALIHFHSFNDCQACCSSPELLPQPRSEYLTVTVTPLYVPNYPKLAPSDILKLPLLCILGVPWKEPILGPEAWGSPWAPPPFSSAKFKHQS